MQRAYTGGLQPSDTGGLERTKTGDFQRPGAGDIQNTAQDIQGGQGPVFSDGDDYPALGFGFYATRGRRPYNEDRIMITPRMNGSLQLNPLVPLALIACLLQFGSIGRFKQM